MAPFLYLLGCITLSALAVLELKSHKRAERIQLYLTLLGALTFCGTFALLVNLAQIDGGQYQPFAAAAIVVLTGGSLFAVSRLSRRFSDLQRSR